MISDTGRSARSCDGVSDLDGFTVRPMRSWSRDSVCGASPPDKRCTDLGVSPCHGHPAAELGLGSRPTAHPSIHETLSAGPIRTISGRKPKSGEHLVAIELILGPTRHAPVGLLTAQTLEAYGGSMSPVLATAGCRGVENGLDYDSSAFFSPCLVSGSGHSNEGRVVAGGNEHLVGVLSGLDDPELPVVEELHRFELSRQVDVGVAI